MLDHSPASVVSQNQGGTIGGPRSQDYSILGSPYFGKLPSLMGVGIEVQGRQALDVCVYI